MWTPERPLKELNEEILEEYIQHADFLYRDLRENKLTIVLAPASEPKHCLHMIRKTVVYNPEWYSELYWSHNSFRRDLSMLALDRLRNLEDKPLGSVKYRYDTVYRELIHGDLTRGYEREGEFIQPNNYIRAFFDMPPLTFPTKKKKNIENDEILPF